MIATPKLSQLHFDTALMGGVGYVLGRLANVNEILSASVLAIASIANYILFAVANRWVRPILNRLVHPYFEFSPQAIYTGSNALVSTVAILAAQQLNLIGRRMAGVCLFFSASILVARISLLS